MLSSIDDKLECNLDLFSDIFTADVIFTEAESTTLFRALGARSPANWTNTGAVFALGVAESSTLHLILVAGETLVALSA